jgi:predicted acyltransferase
MLGFERSLDQRTARASHQSTRVAAGGSVRLRSVDVFRGVTIAAMVIVNNPGDWNNVYPPLLHAEWHGWTPTDLVFPFFLFIVGVAITLSPKSTGAVGGVLRRAAMIFGLGLFLSGFPFFDLATWRIPGVLQRIAVCYLAAVVIVRLAAARHGNTESIETRSRYATAQMRRLAVVIVAIVLSYAALMLWVPAPGGQAGDLTPEGNLGAWLDRALMRGHLWRPQWDPEGLLSTLPAIATTLMGVLAGQALRLTPALWEAGAPATRFGSGGVEEWRRYLVISGLACVTLGAIWHLWFPINKGLWTSSYVLFTGGLAAISLALCSLWSDDRPGDFYPTTQAKRVGDTGRHAGWLRRTSEPFVALGRNAILLFVLSGLIARVIGVVMVDQAARLSLKGWIYSTLFVPLASPRNASLLFAVTNLLLLYALLAWLHRRRLYWKV